MIIRLFAGERDFPNAKDFILTQRRFRDIRGLQLILSNNNQGPGIGRIIATVVVAVKVVIDNDNRISVIT